MVEWDTLLRKISFHLSTISKQKGIDQKMRHTELVFTPEKKKVPGISDDPDKVFHTVYATGRFADTRALRYW